MDIYSKQDKKKVLALALFAGEVMLINGAETYRVEDTIRRICNSKGLHHISSFVTPTVIIIGDDRHDGYTFIKRIDKRTTNFEKISLVNSLSRDFVEGKITVEESEEILQKICNKEPYRQMYRIFWCALASSMFAYLFGGGIKDVFSGFVITMLTTKIGEILDEYEVNPFILNSVCAAIIAVLALLFYKIGIGDKLDMIIAASIMPQLPGFSLMNGIRDFIAGDLLSGISRAFEALVIAISIAVSIGSILGLYYSLGGAI